jgi:4-alpha-glucanotransferase
LEDPWQKDKYHPRLGAINDSVYNLLNQEEKDAYLKIYNNYFYDRHNIFWEQIGRRRLEEMIADTDLLVCAEDLGMIPGCVPAVLSGLGILSLEVQTMPKAQGYEFTHLEANPYLSVCTISTHDMPTMRMWWEENTDRTQRYYMSMLQKEGKAPRTLSATLSGEIVARHLNSPSMLCMIAVQDWLAMSDECRAKDAHSERINSPYDSYNRWQYRMPVTIETLISNTTLNRKIKNMIRGSKR